MTEHEKPSHIEILTDACDLCGACIAVCPPNVMNIIHDKLFIDFEGCTYCSLCIYICPVRAIKGHYDRDYYKKHPSKYIHNE